VRVEDRATHIHVGLLTWTLWFN